MKGTHREVQACSAHRHPSGVGSRPVSGAGQLLLEQAPGRHLLGKRSRVRYKVVSAIFATLPRLGCLAGLRVLLAAAMALALLAFIGAPANAEEQTATSDDITAVFSFDQPQAYKWGNLHLTITRAGQVAYDAPVTARNCREPYCSPGGFDKTKSAR